MKFTQRGFTLFEVVLVLAIGMSVTSLGVITLSRLQGIFQLRGAADEMIAIIQHGRELAVANKNQVPYGLVLTGMSLILTAGGKEFSRYQIPQKISLNPASFNWTFSPISGMIPACSPCQITLTTAMSSEIINIQANGLVY